jgi:hypothetical protein
MTTANLIKKLTNLNIPYNIVNTNEYNKEIVFTIKYITFRADYNVDKNIINSYYKVTGYDNLSQETTRRFFDNFNKVLRYSSTK